MISNESMFYVLQTEEKEQKAGPGTASEEFYKKSVFKNFAKFTRKHLFSGLFFNKAAGLSLKLCLKRDSGTGVFL